MSPDKAYLYGYIGIWLLLSCLMEIKPAWARFVIIITNVLALLSLYKL